MPFTNCLQTPGPGSDLFFEAGAGVAKVLTWTALDATGQPRVFAPGESASLVVREYAGSNLLYFKVDGVIGVDGEVSFHIPASKLGKPGLWSAAVAILNTDSDETDAIVEEYKAWLRVTQSTAARGDGNLPPVDLSDIREILWDRFPEDNFLLDAVEFSEEQVAKAVWQVVDKWNETPPNVGTFTAASFPWRHHHALGAAARLLRQAAINQARNTLQYQAGGVGVKDKGKHGDYTQLSQMLEREFTEWMANKKIELNISTFYGRLGSGVY